MCRYISGGLTITCGVITCPVVCAGSCLVGFGLTLTACSDCCRCLEDDFLKEREKVCTYCGVGTSIQVATHLCKTGYQEIVVEYEMIR